MYKIRIECLKKKRAKNELIDGEWIAKKMRKPFRYYYGSILETLSGDGDELDCIFVDDQKRQVGEIVQAKPYAIIFENDNGKSDHKIVMFSTFDYKKINKAIKEHLKNAHKYKKGVRVLGVADTTEAIRQINILKKHG